MAGGGGGGGTQRVVNSNLPEYARPYYESLMGRTQVESYAPYEEYGGKRIAGMDTAQNQAYSMAQGLAGSSSQLGQAQNMAQSGFNASQKPGASLNYYQQSAAPQVQVGQFGQSQADQYMSPYMQSVVDVQKREATREANRQMADTNLNLASKGAFGGTRQAIINAEANRNLSQQLGDIQQKGSQAAFENAQQQYERDRAASLTAQQANQQAGLQVGGRNLEALMRTQEANAANQRADLQRAMQGAYQGADIMRQLGGQGQQMSIDQINLLNQLGGQRQALNQQQADINYQNFLNRRDWSRNQLSWLAGIMHGNPISFNQVEYQPQSTNYASQIAGLGAAGLGAWSNSRQGGG